CNCFAWVDSCIVCAKQMSLDVTSNPVRNAMLKLSLNQIFLPVWLIALTFGLYPQAPRQNPPASDLTIEEIIRLDTNLVVLDVQVLDRKTGEIVSGLKPTDFELFEDGLRQDVTHFSQDKLSLSVVLLMDLSGSVSPVLKEIQSGALLALDRLKENDEVA